MMILMMNLSGNQVTLKHLSEMQCCYNRVCNEEVATDQKWMFAMKEKLEMIEKN